MAKKKQGITWTNERRKLSDLIPWERNPRTINNAQAERLVDSVETFGQVETLAIDCRNGVLNGHQRLNVLAGQYGMDYEVDVRVANRVLTERERQQLTVYLHRGTTGEWDFEELANSFEFDDLVTWGFSEEELLGLDFDEEPTSAGADTPPEIDKAEELRVKWGVETGMMFALGEHRLICGDCTDPAVVARVMGGEKAGAVVTDPPYGINHEGIPNDDPEGLQDLFDGCLRVFPSDSAVVIAFQSPRLFWVWLDAARRAGHKFERSLWMHKSNDVTYPWRGWMMNGEPIFVSSIGDPEWGKAAAVQDCYIITHDTEKNIPHKSIKPLTVVENLIAHTVGVVYEPFSGSGTAIIACQNLGRKCRAVEISPAYVAVAIERFYQHTGIEPVLIA